METSTDSSAAVLAEDLDRLNALIITLRKEKVRVMVE